MDVAKRVGSPPPAAARCLRLRDAPSPALKAATANSAPLAAVVDGHGLEPAAEARFAAEQVVQVAQVADAERDVVGARRAVDRPGARSSAASRPRCSAVTWKVPTLSPSALRAFGLRLDSARATATESAGSTPACSDATWMASTSRCFAPSRCGRIAGVSGQSPRPPAGAVSGATAASAGCGSGERGHRPATGPPGVGRRCRGGWSAPLRSAGRRPPSGATAAAGAGRGTGRAPDSDAPRTPRGPGHRSRHVPSGSREAAVQAGCQPGGPPMRGPGGRPRGSRRHPPAGSAAPRTRLTARIEGAR